jgi:hypothetical protein
MLTARWSSTEFSQVHCIELRPSPTLFAATEPQMQVGRSQERLLPI